MKTMPKLILAALAAFTLCLGARALEQDTDGYYMLGSVQDWQDFATLIKTTPTANAKMVADIATIRRILVRYMRLAEMGTIIPSISRAFLTGKGIH